MTCSEQIGTHKTMGENFAPSLLKSEGEVLAEIYWLAFQRGAEVEGLEDPNRPALVGSADVEENLTDMPEA
jgi:hypothetical protein